MCTKDLLRFEKGGFCFQFECVLILDQWIRWLPSARVYLRPWREISRQYSNPRNVLGPSEETSCCNQISMTANELNWNLCTVNLIQRLYLGSMLPGAWFYIGAIWNAYKGYTVLTHGYYLGTFREYIFEDLYFWGSQIMSPSIFLRSWCRHTVFFTHFKNWVIGLPLIRQFMLFCYQFRVWCSQFYLLIVLTCSSIAVKVKVRPF